MEYNLEERQEVCSIASKIVVIKIYRYPASNPDAAGEIADFQCNHSSANCESRCTYKLLMSDY